MKKLTLLSLLAGSLITLQSFAGMVNFGSAERYTMAVGSNTGSLLLGSEADVWGNVAAQYYLSLASGAKVHGDACTNAISEGAGSNILGSKLTNGQCSNINQLSTDIAHANKQAAELSNQYMFGDIESSKSLSASEHSVYKVGNLNLDTGEYLTINGGINDTTVINVSGLASIDSGAGILLNGGILAKNVIFNFLDNPSMTNFIFGGAIINGTFLANNRSFQLGDGATLDNTRFFTNASIQANVQTVKFGGTTKVPEPSTLLLILVALSFLLLKTNRKHQ